MSKLDDLKRLREWKTAQAKEPNPFEDAARGRDRAPKSSGEYAPPSPEAKPKKKRAPRGTFDRKAYQREYMSRLRQKQK